MSTPAFDPLIHLSPHYTTPLSTKMSDLGYGDLQSPSATAVTKPFPLFTLPAVRLMRQELFDHNTLANHLYSDTLNPSTIRGAARPDRARFIYEAWKHPEVMRRLSDAAGVDLTLVFDYEIGHTNLQLGPRGWGGLHPTPDLPTTSGKLGAVSEIRPTLMLSPNWHKDSYPFVCILMLSESSHIQGGRTVLRKADGTSLFCDLPPIGHAMILQGGHIIHAVSPTDTTQERISMVTSLRPADPLAHDISVLTTVRTMSDTKELHRQWCLYRMHVLARRAEAFSKRLEAWEVQEKDERRSVEEEMARFVEEQGEYLAHTLGEMTKPVESVRTSTIRDTFLRWKRRNAGMLESRL